MRRSRHLDGQKVSRSPLLAQVHAPKGSPADGLQDLKVVNGHAADVIATGAGGRRGRACGMQNVLVCACLHSKLTTSTCSATCAPASNSLGSTMHISSGWTSGQHGCQLVGSDDAESPCLSVCVH